MGRGQFFAEVGFGIGELARNKIELDNVGELRLLVKMLSVQEEQVWPRMIVDWIASRDPLCKFSVLVLWWCQTGCTQACYASFWRHAARSGKPPRMDLCFSSAANFCAHPLNETNTPGSSFTIRAPRRRCGQQHCPSSARSVRAFDTVKTARGQCGRGRCRTVDR